MPMLLRQSVKNNAAKLQTMATVLQVEEQARKRTSTVADLSKRIILNDFDLLKETIMVGRLNCGPCEAMWWRGVAVVGLMVMAARLIRFLFFSAQHPIAEGWTVALVVFIMSFKLIHRWVYLRSLFHQDHGHLAALLYSLGDTFTQDVSLDDEKDDDNTSLSPSPESCLGSVPALRNCMGCFFTYAGRCGFNGGLIADKRERGLRKSLTDEPSFDPVPVQNSAPATEEGRAAAEEQDGEAKASGPTTDSSTRGHHLQLPASAKVRELRGAFSEMVSGMGVILLAISMWLCWVTVMGGARRDAVGALLDVIAAAWYLVFVRVPSCLDFLRRPSINQSINQSINHVVRFASAGFHHAHVLHVVGHRHYEHLPDAG